MASLTDIFSKAFKIFTEPDSKILDDKYTDSKIKHPDPDSGKPNRAWLKRFQKQNRECVKQLDPNTPITKDSIRFVCISDTHTKLEEKRGMRIPDGDVLLHAGDFTMTGLPEEVEITNKYLGALRHPIKIIIAGNHDNTFDLDFIRRKRSTGYWYLTTETYEKYLEERGVSTVHELLTDCIYLQDTAVEICGINIYGSPWTAGHGSWGFQRPRGPGLLKKWNLIPKNTDILITHSPPCGYGDDVGQSRIRGTLTRLTKGLVSREDHVGCVDLLNTVQRRVKPKYHVYGHIHEGYGVLTDGQTTFINASTCDVSYRPVNPPIVFDFPVPDGYSKDSLYALDISSFRWKNSADTTQGASDDHKCHKDNGTEDKTSEDYDMCVDDDFFHLDRNVVNVEQSNFSKFYRTKEKLDDDFSDGNSGNGDVVDDDGDEEEEEDDDDVVFDEKL